MDSPAGATPWVYAPHCIEREAAHAQVLAYIAIFVLNRTVCALLRACELRHHLRYFPMWDALQPLVDTDGPVRSCYLGSCDLQMCSFCENGSRVVSASPRTRG